jgi:hypothetical protein
MISRDSFNHFVRGNEQCLRYCEAERFRGLSRSNIAGPRDARSAFVRLKVDVIVTWGTASVLAVKQAEAAKIITLADAAYGPAV